MSCSRHLCPNCEQPLNQFSGPAGNEHPVSYCGICRGVLFPPGGLSNLLEQAKERELESIKQELSLILSPDRFIPPVQIPPRYYRCPDCANLMNRENFGAMTGVILNSCSQHGTWIGCGGLDRLIEFAVSGGAERSELLNKERQRNAKLRADQEKLDAEADEKKMRRSSAVFDPLI